MAEVYIEGKRLDVFEKLNFSFNYSIADIRHPDKRTTEYSKTIKCPSTANNDALLGQIYEVNISNSYDSTEVNIEVNFNPNKKAEAIVISDGIPVMKGSLQLRRISRVNTDMVYEVVFVGKLVDIFGVLGEKMLNGKEPIEVDQDGVFTTTSPTPFIDFSDLDHYYTQANQTASWTAPYGQGYVYPMIDYGKQLKYDYGTGETLRAYYVTDLKPALYLKDVIDRIFAFAGFTYTSSFFDSAFFKRLIIPVSSKSTNDDQRLFRASVTNQSLSTAAQGSNPAFSVGNDSRLTHNSPYAFALICFANDSTGGNFDNGTFTSFGNYWVNPTPYPQPSSGFSTGWASGTSGSYSWRVNQETAGVYNLKVALSFRWRERSFWPTGLPFTYTNTMLWDALVARIQSEYGLAQQESMQGYIRLSRRRLTQSGSAFVVYEIARQPITIPLNNFSSDSSDFETGLVDVSLIAENVECNDGDAIFVSVHFPRTTDDTNATGFSDELAYFDTATDIGYTNATYQLNLLVSGSFENEQVEGADLIDSEYLQMNSNIPEIPMREVMLNVINMFNLYLEPDPNQDKNLLIETRDTFYSQGEVKDWTHKLDHGKEVSLQPLALLTANEFQYSYNSDDDYYNAEYEESHGHVYGRARVDVDNDFLNNTQKTEITFSSTPLVNDNPSNRLVSKIYDSDIEEGVQPTDHNTRVLYYGGMIDSDPRWIHGSVIDGFNYPLQYPYAGHLTHPLAPAQDINFGIPNELYYSANSFTGTLLYTNDNLFNRYHRRHLLEITNKDSKLMTAHFNLSPLDINKLDFRDEILIGNSYWRLNKVMNYNPFDNSLTKVELFKVITKEELKRESFGVGTGGVVTGGSGIERRPVTAKTKKDGNQYPLKSGFVRGENNLVEDGVTNFMLQGRNNHVKSGSADITIIGNDNVVEEGLTGIRLINTNGATITRSNVTLINNREQSSSAVIEGGDNEVRALDGGTNIFTVDGGLNTVQTQFSETSIYLIDGN